MIQSRVTACCCCVHVLPASSDHLFKAAAHFGRDKIKKQAAYLVGRLNKYQGLLPAARDRLAEQLRSLGDMPTPQVQQLLPRMQQALRQWALGALLACAFLAMGYGDCMRAASDCSNTSQPTA